MPDVDPAYYDAVDEVVESRQADAEWDPDEMRSALIDVAQGASQEAAAEDREFSQPLVSKRWSDVEAVYEQIKDQQDSQSTLFRDPLEEAIGEFRNFFENLNEKYDMGINSRAITMMEDEIRDAEQLPAAMYVENFLRGTNSGVTGQDVDYIRRRYDQWLQNYQQEQQGGGGMPGGMGSFGGANVQQQQQQQQQSPPGVPVAGQPQQGGGMGQQPQQQPQGQPPQRGGTDPEVEELREELEEVKEFLAAQAEEQGQAQSEMVTIQKDDGTVIEMPLQQAIEAGYLDDQSDDEDFLDKMRKAQEAGIMPSPDDGDDGDDLIETIQTLRELGLVGDDDEKEMASAIGEAIESLGEKQMQAQQQMSQNFSNVLNQMRDMQESEDDDLTPDDVQSIIEDTLKEDEVERLERELQSMRSEFRDSLENVARRSGDATDDTEFMKVDREMEFRENQMETLNENLKELPKQLSMAVQQGVLPAVKELQSNQPGAGNPLWSPPQQQQRQQPGFTPDTVGGGQQQQAAAQQRAQQRAQQQAAAQQRAQSQRVEEMPQAEQAEPQAEQAAQGMGQEEPESGTEERATDVREKLGLEDDNDQEPVEA